jgi:hypothetical protein
MLRCSASEALRAQTGAVEWLTGAIVVVLVGAVMLGLGSLARRVRRRGTAGQALAAPMAAYDEGFHGTAHDAFVELRAEDERTAPTTSPDEPR